ncbi:RNA polymerase sigma factor [Sphingomonas sp. OTU376]|uniref:RNA polymerase sigma factor n=1 Tax=Sphingomonas sp. OTU376 TaxID=3043863 RepID=UPI00313DFE9F
MTWLSQPTTRVYRVAIEFQSCKESYAFEIYCVRATDAFDAERLARARAEASTYHNAQVPGLALLVHIAPVETPNPDNDSPPTAPATSGLAGAVVEYLVSVTPPDGILDPRKNEDLTGFSGVWPRRAGYGEPPALASAPGYPDTGPRVSFDYAAYRAVVDALPYLQRRAFRLHRAQGLDYEAIARKLEISTRDVEQLIASALLTLIKLLPFPDPDET